MASSRSHDASASALGYLYQAKWALLELLRGVCTVSGSGP
jgi:hypothetical protein